MKFLFQTALVSAATAVLVSAAVPAQAHDGRYRGRDGIDAGDVIAGAAHAAHAHWLQARADAARRARHAESHGENPARAPRERRDALFARRGRDGPRVV